jgi:hypothetical protein
VDESKHYARLVSARKKYQAVQVWFKEKMPIDLNT